MLFFFFRFTPAEFHAYADIAFEALIAAATRHDIDTLAADYHFFFDIR